jgi:hypothetical protein
MNDLRQKIADRDAGITELFPKPPERHLIEAAEGMQRGFVRAAYLAHLGLTEDDLALCANCNRQSWRHDELGRCPEA